MKLNLEGARWMGISGTRVAVIGAGLAGSACARLLADAGLEVSIFDKSRGVGGRMSTRRSEWTSETGIAGRGRFDHGAPGFIAQTPEFNIFVEQYAARGLLARWVPRAPGTTGAPEHQPALWVSTPDMPALCRALCTGLDLHTECAVDTLKRSPEGWTLESAGTCVGSGFDGVIIAVPPQQAAPLLEPHQAVWSQRAKETNMLPAWVLMGVTEETNTNPPWDLAHPNTEVLGLVIRNDSKPGREPVPGLAHWVVHATEDWSRIHLESPVAQVQVSLQQALSDFLGRPLTWVHSAVHRWRYASAPARTSCTSAESCWWDAQKGLGVCGDSLGGAGVEGAWNSARALASHFLHHRPGSQAQSAVV